MSKTISAKEINSFRETLSDKLKNRTIGLELEYSNGDKELIKLPLGYKFTDNKFSGHFNTTTVEIKNNGRYGGEINTKPTRLIEEDIYELEELNSSIWNSGAKLNWYIEIHIHIYIKDMLIEDIKKINDAIFLFGNLNSKVFQMPEWNDTPYATPLMTKETHDKVNNSNSIEDIANSFKNGSARGFHRPYISMAQIESIGTMEYRHFPGSTDFIHIWEYIKFSYRFIDYCLNTSYEEKEKVVDQEEFVSMLQIDKSKLKIPMKPFIYAADHKDNTTNIGEMWNKSRPMLSAMKKAVGKNDVFLYNSFNFDIEQVLTESNIKVFSNNAYIHFMYDIINKNISFKFPEEFTFLDHEEESTPADKISRVLLFFDLVKKVDSKEFYAQRYFENTKGNVVNILRKMTEKSSRLVENLKGRVEVVYGSFNDMVYAQEEEVIIYHYEEPSTMKSLHNKVVKYFGYEMERLLNDYSLITEFKNYVFLSQNQFLPYKLNYTDGRYYVYSDRTEKSIHKITSRTVEPLFYKELPNDHVITKKSVIKFIRAKGSEVDYIRQKYLSKNIIMGSAVYNYLWFIDDYLFGACMLDYPRRKIGPGTVWLKSDFVIDSEVPKLSKLLIMGILSEEFRKETMVRFKENINFYVTNVFTTKPISMKYRGVFKLHTREAGKLIYVGEAGKNGRLKQEVISKYLISTKEK